MTTRNKRILSNSSAILAACAIVFATTSFAPWATAATQDNTDTGVPAMHMPPPPPGNGHSGPPPGPMMVQELGKQDTSKYFDDLTAATGDVNAYIDYLYEQKVIPTDGRLFFPEKALTRADLATMLSAKYHYDITIREAGGDEFTPDAPVTREQAALWIFNGELQAGMPRELISSDLSSFNDAKSISKDSAQAIATMVRFGILTADASGNFNPAGTLNRAEFAPGMYRLLQLGGGAGAPPGAGAGPGGPPPGGASHTVDHGTSANTIDTDISGATYSSTGDAENALRIQGKAKVTLEDIKVDKLSGDPGNGDMSNFYGANAGILALEGANATIDRATVTTSARGANGVFAYGKETSIMLNEPYIRTSQGGSGAVMVTGGAAMVVKNGDFETQGDSSAPLRTDRGGGTLAVQGGKYVAHGMGSPAIYSTADISVADAELTATGSEAVVIEGKNSVNLQNCQVTGRMMRDNVENLQNVMIYQSMSGDATMGKGRFTMEGGSLTSENGDMFYVTNTSAEIQLHAVDLTLASNYLLKVVGNDARTGWGVAGKNGGTCTFTAKSQKLTGRVKVDSISTLNLNLSEGTNFAGTINPENEGGNVSVILDKTSIWSMTGDAYITALKGSTEQIKTNGHHLYVGGTLLK